MFALDLLRITLARAVLCGIQMPGICAPMIGMIAPNAKGGQQGFQLDKDFVLTPPKDVRQDLPTAVIDGVPQPSLVLLLAHKTPHLVDFRFVDPADHDIHGLRIESLEEGFVHRCEYSPFFFNSLSTVRVLICNTRAVSRTPLAFRVMSIELFPNSISSGSKARRRCQSNRLQNPLYGCGNAVPEC